MNERDLFGQQLINAEFDDGVRLAAADFHDVPRPGRDAVNLPRQLLRAFAIAIFVKVFHFAFVLPNG